MALGAPLGAWESTPMPNPPVRILLGTLALCAASACSSDRRDGPLGPRGTALPPPGMEGTAAAGTATAPPHAVAGAPAGAPASPTRR